MKQKEENAREKENQVGVAKDAAAPEPSKPEPSKAAEAGKNAFDLGGWNPRTSTGKKVKSGEITSLSQVLETGQGVLEAEIVDALISDMTMDLLLIGQAKGKFGGGQRRAFRQTQKKTAEGNKPNFATYVVIGNKNGFVGLGYGKSRETVPAREKAIRNAKLNVMKIRRGCGSWQCSCSEPHSIPFAVTGKCGSSTITLIPAPKGTGLCVEKECQKILAAAGVKDIWSRTEGQTRTKTNLIAACELALKKLVTTKVRERSVSSLGIVDGEVKKEEKAEA